MKRRIHLICNAHLDPVWLWEWQEGAAEAISTFRTAAELCEKYDTFIFNHNEVILYKWVEEYEPSLFKRIQKLVKQGRWHIMGGWYLQPDCNMPSGESFVRQILAGRDYFISRFGVYPKTAINFDPFGHSRGLVQILAKSGFTSYLFGRPQSDYIDLPNAPFVWVGFDGSEVLARRFVGWYNTPLGKARQEIEDRINASPNAVDVILWGVGNHGGGPSRKDLADIEQLIRQRKDVQILHSTPEQYFKEVAKTADKLTRRADDLNPWAPGCYTSMVRIKQHHRFLENELYMTEKMVSAAVVNGLMNYPKEPLAQAQEDLLFAEFHDILPGSCVEPSQEAALRLMGHGLEVLSRIKARAFFALAAGQPKAKEGQIPVMVYNPQPYPSRQIVECEFNLPDFNLSGTFTQIHLTQDGKPIACQVEKEISNLACDWRKHVVFYAELQPGMNRFDCQLEVIPAKPPVKIKPKNGKVRIAGKTFEVVINTKTGLVDRYRLEGVDYVACGAFCPVVLEDNFDPWETQKTKFGKVVGKFKLLDRQQGTKLSGLEGKLLLDSVRVIEDGAVRTVVEAMLGYQESYLCQRYHICKHTGQLYIESRVFWNQKDKMLKLAVPLAHPLGKYLGQTAFGVQPLPTDGKEAVSQKWVCAVDAQNRYALACLNDGTYGSDIRDGQMRLTLLRGPAYAGHPVADNPVLSPDRFIPRIDQGERVFHFWLFGGQVKKVLSQVGAAAQAVNEKPFALSFFPLGEGKKPKPLILLDNSAIELSAFKAAQKGADWVARLFNGTASTQQAQMTCPALGCRKSITFGPYEVKTFKISRSGAVQEVNLVEQPL